MKMARFWRDVVATKNRPRAPGRLAIGPAMTCSRAAAPRAGGFTSGSALIVAFWDGSPLAGP